MFAMNMKKMRVMRVAQLKINLLPDGWLRQAWDELCQQFFSLKIICKATITILENSVFRKYLYFEGGVMHFNRASLENLLMGTFVKKEEASNV